MNNFESLNLSENLNLALAKMNFSKPTPIQAQTIPFCSTKQGYTWVLHKQVLVKQLHFVFRW